MNKTETIEVFKNSDIIRAVMSIIRDTPGSVEGSTIHSSALIVANLSEIRQKVGEKFGISIPDHDSRIATVGSLVTVAKEALLKDLSVAISQLSPTP